VGTLFGIKGGIVAAMVLVGLICLAVISRNWSCRQHRPPRPPQSRQYVVQEVPNGGTLLVKAGLRERRTVTIVLADIAAPPIDGPLGEAARTNLERYSGKTIRVEFERRRLLAVADGEEEPTAVEDRGPIVAIVYGESGCCLNLEQIMDGMATCLPSAPKEWKREEAIARKKKLGLWQKEN